MLDLFRWTAFDEECGDWFRPSRKALKKVVDNLDEFYKIFPVTWEYQPIWKDEGYCWTLSLDCPGVKKENLKLELKDNKLYLFYTQEEKKCVFTSCKSFSYSWDVDVGVKEGDISAEYKNGVLYLQVKKPPTSQPKQIPID